MKRIIAISLALFVSCASFSQVFGTFGKKMLLPPPVQNSKLPTMNLNKTDATIPRNFYAQHLGFFCKEELKMQQAHIPLTFRLGSIDYCNKLEQKGDH